MLRKVILTRYGFVELSFIIILLSILAVGLSGREKMDIEKLSYFLLTVGCFGITIFMLKKWINDVVITIKEVRSEIDSINNKMTNLLVSLPKEYADKNETKQSVEAIWKRVDEHSIAIAKIQGRD